MGSVIEMVSENTDLEKVTAWANGDSLTGELLVISCYCKLKNWISGQLPNPCPGREQICEDVAHDALIRAMDILDTYEGRSSFFTWLCGIAKNCLWERQREGRKLVNLQYKLTDNWLTLDRANSIFPDPEQNYIHKEETEQVRKAFESLSEQDQDVIYCHTFIGMTYKEIASELRDTEGAIRVRHFRAIQKLKNNFHNML